VDAKKRTWNQVRHSLKIQPATSVMEVGGGTCREIGDIGVNEKPDEEYSKCVLKF